MKSWSESKLLFNSFPSYIYTFKQAWNVGLWTSLKRTTNKQSVIPHSCSSRTASKLGGEWGWFLLLFCPMHCKHKPCRSESSGSYCCWQIHWARKSEEAESLWPMGHCLTFYFAKNHTPDSDTSILTSGRSPPRGLGARFANSQVELSFFTCKIYVELTPWHVGSNECLNNSTCTWATFLLHLTGYSS